MDCIPRERAAVVAIAAVLATVSAGALAQAYPAKPVRVVVPSSPGGGTDIVARIIAPDLAKRLGQQIVIENRAGAGTMIGIEVVAKAPPDGYTLLMGLSTLAINPALFRKVPYDAARDFAPITLAISSPAILTVHPSVPARSVKELIAFARVRPGQLNYASAGTGTFPHMSMELFLSMAKLRMEHIPYKGTGPATIDLVAGHVGAMSGTILSVMGHIRAGRLRALGITSSTRSASAPDVPTVSESGLPGYEATQWYGLLAPAQTAKDIVGQLHTETTRVLQQPEIRERFVADGADPVGNTPEEFRGYIQSEITKWAKVAREAGIKPE